MPPFRVIVFEQREDRTATLVVSLERAPDVGSVVELPQSQSVLVRHILSDDQDGLAGIILAAPAEE